MSTLEENRTKEDRKEGGSKGKQERDGEARASMEKKKGGREGEALTSRGERMG